ncbi:LLM class flavin-dependent oxidoreductase [Microbacterium sp. H1-D42]|uniref:LLM class flavin-dependent oxidoreductase n=1 Tax=Microbacterium sp. H1-D42 TaxID=2925844 RepID=UPI001F538188|nr:LLM class flavin-dependent oxidoreductase [Microbacterium sp. H1-D42]UNK70347.1 LLM class flavin-dependent oxidoreductase [Microbacterium sp. H1-D42]
MTRIGAVFNPYHHAPEELRAAVQVAEAAGVPELWLWEDCFRESGYASAAAALAWSENLRIGLGIAPLPLRNVAVTAMEIATIERMFPGRFLPGLGHGVQSWMAQVGAKVASPLTLMREQVTALRALLAGEEVSMSGRYVTLDAVRLDWPVDSAPPVYAAGQGAKTLALTGEIADGTVLVSGLTPAEVGAQVAQVRAGRAAGLGGDTTVVAYVTAAFGDGAAARVIAQHGDDAVEVSRGLCGTPAEVAAGVAGFTEVGVDAVILDPAADEPDFHGFLRAAGEVARIVG